MKHCLKVAAFSAALIGVVAGPCAAEDTSPLTGSASVAFLSDYMWRGFNLFDGSSIQPTVGAEYDTGAGKLGANVWAHLSAEGGDSAATKFTEFDYTLSYAFSLSPLSFKVGHLWYTYPISDDNLEDTAEFFGTVVVDDAALGSPFALNPTFSVYHDYDLVDGQYYELGLSHAFEIPALGDGFNMTPYVAFGYAQNQEPVYAEDGFVQTTFGVSSNLSLGSFAVVPSLNYTAESDNNLKNEFWFGFSLSKGF